MAVTNAVQPAVRSALATSVAGSGGGVVPDPYGPELLTNPEMTGYVAGSPGTPPTGWLNLQTTGSIASPAVTFIGLASRRAFYQSNAVTPGTYKLEVDAVLNSGTATFYDSLYFATPAGTTVAYYIDGVSAINSTPWSGSKRLSAIITVVNAGNIEFRAGVGLVGDRTQSVTINNPTMKRAV